MKHDPKEAIVVGVNDKKRQRRVMGNNELSKLRDIPSLEEGKVDASNYFTLMATKGNVD